MSSSLVEQQQPFPDLWSGSTYRNQYEQRQISLRSERDSASNYCFTGGLPTPPASKRMNVVASALNSARVPLSGCSANAVGFQQSTYPSQKYATYPTQAPSQPSKAVAMNDFAGMAMPMDDRLQQDEIASHLQIPESVNKSKGSLSEFAAEIASLFWFESADTLQYAEDLPLDEATDRGLVADAVPSVGFRKWVTTILSTTQVGKNVILLGLLFIYRLKQFNPGVSGKRGSEFRLLTIALMLGNKFLDDNTYTNKTWAEVSGISVTEIHIMEVEFLSNMRYDLYVSAEEWTEWKSKLGRLGAFYEKAARFNTRSTPMPVTPTVPVSPHVLPSPPSNRSANTLNKAYIGLPNPALNAPQLQVSPSRTQRYGSADILDSRKRSLDLSSDEPAAKRLHMSSRPRTDHITASYPSGGTTLSTAQNMPPLRNMQSSTMPRLPMPRLPLSVSTSTPTENHLAPLQLPGPRAMTNVFANVSTAPWSNPVTPIAQADLYQQPMPGFGDISRSQSAANSARTSPNGYTLTPMHSGTSPSYFLTNRQSPYRPVRHVNTLLYPPPSATLQNQVRNVGHDQIHYQPLSKSDFERRTGPVPYHHLDNYYQSNTNTPLTQKYSYRP